MFRLFFREKTNESLLRKIDKRADGYRGEKKIQDIVGVRVALYFMDDILAVRNILEKNFKYIPKDSSFSEHSGDTFKATKYNLIFNLPEDFSVEDIVDDEIRDCIDGTFEVQIRTILSEGWHEIDHDLRYKCEDDWCDLNTENRALNGVYATLETSEWTLLKLFEEIAYKHYKNGNWRAMIQNKFRLRFIASEFDTDLIDKFFNERGFAKQIYRYDRNRLFDCISVRGRMPVSIGLILCIINLDKIKDDELINLTPPLVLRWWNSVTSNLVGSQ